MSAAAKFSKFYKPEMTIDAKHVKRKELGKYLPAELFTKPQKTPKVIKVRRPLTSNADHMFQEPKESDNKAEEVQADSTNQNGNGTPAPAPELNVSRALVHLATSPLLCCQESLNSSKRALEDEPEAEEPLPDKKLKTDFSPIDKAFPQEVSSV